MTHYSPDRARRNFLKGVGAAGAIGTAGLLAACGGGDPYSGSDPDEPATGAPNGSGSSGDQGSGTPLTTTAAVPVGGGTIFADKKVVVTQPAAGDFKCFSAVCTHQGCTVSSVTETGIECACHGSVFSVDDGSVLSGPASSPLPAETITVDGDSITLG
ncbi:Rieske (2Fe-2S) protein [Phytomonospora sp. NPDC050363]|uniref:Rieske (2Fe-2S) protein n=1 Tax=Phytomonospora sp. NPDC050363 TaxID=3155642 RepID=UPI0033EAF785